MFTDPIAETTFKNIVELYEIKSFVETGTDQGNGCLGAIKYVNYVFSIEILKEKFQQAIQNLVSHGFGVSESNENISIHNLGDKTITLFRGNSIDILPQIIPRVPEPICFFLDAHWMTYWPIKDEIRAIKPKPDSVIIVHDCFVPGRDYGYDCYAEVYIDKNMVKKENFVSLDFNLIRDDLQCVNPDFNVCYNLEAKGDKRGILYAFPPIIK